MRTNTNRLKLPPFITEEPAFRYALECEEDKETHKHQIIGNFDVDTTNVLKTHDDYNTELNKLQGRVTALEKYCVYLEHITMLKFIEEFQLTPDKIWKDGEIHL